MKHTRFITLALALVLAAAIFLTACSGSGNNTGPVERYQPGEPAPYGSALLKYQGLAENGEFTFDSTVEPLGGRTRQGFLYDFDYMMGVLEDNYPFFGVIERRFGVDMREVAARVREMIADETKEIDAQIFYDILDEHFYPYGGGVGHLRPVSPDMYHNKLEDLLQTYDYRNLALLSSMTSAAAVDFYGELIPREEIIPRYELMGYESNLIFDIITDGEIAYMKMVTMATLDPSFKNEVALMTGFYERISGFEHLIVDIRGNPGGQTTLFDTLILAPNTTETLTVPMLGFYRDAEPNLSYLETFDLGIATPAGHIDKETIPDYNDEDFACIDYMVGIEWEVEREPEFIEIPPLGFEGKIWLLIDGSCYSAAEVAAFMARQSGVITLVGEQSGGCIGGTEANWVLLPNSGIFFRYDPVQVTDESGRCLNEFPTLPHHFNLPGMDALETTLALINEQ